MLRRPTKQEHDEYDRKIGIKGRSGSRDELVCGCGIFWWYWATTPDWGARFAYNNRELAMKPGHCLCGQLFYSPEVFSILLVSDRSDVSYDEFCRLLDL